LKATGIPDVFDDFSERGSRRNQRVCHKIFFKKNLLPLRLTYQPCDDVREIKLKTASLTACANKQKIMLHGQHWRSFVDTDEEIIARLEHAVRTGEPLPPEDTDVPEGGFYYARSDDRPLCAIAVIQKREGEFHAINCHPLPPRCHLAKVVLDGVERTAALLYPKGKNAPNNGAFFNGRDGFVSSLRVLPPDQFDILKVEDTR
jgi:hypothetical protein